MVLRIAQLGAVLVAAAALAALAPTDRPADASARSADSWWAYRPLVRPAQPAVESNAWVANPIDAFILQKLEAAGLEPNPRAGKVELIRRATYDLIGLPPTPEEVSDFVDDESPDAWDRLIDRLLASPHYGEKWGRHWLDLVRFAETDSYERDRLKPSAWKYRDYVIDSFNQDKPFNQFIIEQLAGDEVDRPTLETMIATGYYRLGIWDDEPTDLLQAQYDDLDSILATTSQVMLGMTLNCARCHDHKGDPLSQNDYYRLLAFFENIKPYKAQGGNAPTPANYLETLPVDLGAHAFEEELAAYRARREQLIARLRETHERVRGDSDSEGPTPGPVHTIDFSTIAGFPGEVIESDVVGSAARFDGRDDFIEIQRPVQNDFTILFSFRTRSIGPGGTDVRWFLGAGLIDGEVPGIVPDFGVSYHSDGRITAGTGQPETFIHSSPGYNDGEWHHVALTRNQRSGEVALWIDGEDVARATGSTEPLDRPDNLAVGRMLPGHRYFEGELADIRFYDRALTTRDIWSLAYGFHSSPDGLDRIANALGNEERRRFEQNFAELTALERPVRDSTEVLLVKEKATAPEPSFVRLRGNVHAKGDEVTPGFPEVLGFDDPLIEPCGDDVRTSGRRRALAEWITSSDNMLTPRVMANRLWQYHFGRAIVATPNDFGRLGERPTHPQLLDWLAAELIDREWSLKSMHQLIMMSSTYQMSSRGQARGLAADAQNELFWRYPMRRLTAEEIRDSILAVNGSLNSQTGGPGVYPPLPAEVLQTSSRPGQAWGSSSPEQSARRSVYIHVKRSLLTPLLESFDLADTDQSCPVRFQTTQPTQSLTMLNSEFMQTQAATFAERLVRDAGDTLPAQIDLAFQLTASRPATADDTRQAIAFIETMQRDEGMSFDQARTQFCLIMLNLNHFLYLD